MEILDHSEKSPIHQHKKSYYITYSFFLVILLLGPMVLVELGLLELSLLIDDSLGLTVWIGTLVILALVFYWKVMGNYWSVPLVFMAFLISLFVCLYLVDDVFEIPREEPIKAGLVFCLGHGATTLFAAGMHFFIRKRLVKEIS